MVSMLRPMAVVLPPKPAADAELVDLFEHLFFKVCIERVRVLGIKRAHERLLCKQRCFIKRAADAYADDHRRARVRACGLYDLKDEVLDALASRRTA